MHALSRFVALASIALATSSAFAQTNYPLSVDNCGFTVELAGAPQRVVTIKSTATEMLLALGLADRIVGVGFQDGPVPPQWAGAELPVLLDKLPSQEVVLETEPDFVYGGWESTFAADRPGERRTLPPPEIESYLSPGACPSIRPAKLTFDSAFAEIA